MQENKLELKHLKPLTDKEKEEIYNCKIEHLTIDEIFQKYGDMLSDKAMIELRILAKIPE